MVALQPPFYASCLFALRKAVVGVQETIDNVDVPQPRSDLVTTARERDISWTSTAPATGGDPRLGRSCR